MTTPPTPQTPEEFAKEYIDYYDVHGRDGIEALTQFFQQAIEQGRQAGLAQAEEAEDGDNGAPHMFDHPDLGDAGIGRATSSSLTPQDWENIIEASPAGRRLVVTSDFLRQMVQTMKDERHAGLREGWMEGVEWLAERLNADGFAEWWPMEDNTDNLRVILNRARTENPHRS